MNTDGFTVPEIKEVYLGMRIFEEAKAAGTVRHYVYSNLDYSYKVRIHENLELSRLILSTISLYFRKEATKICTSASTTMAKEELRTG